MWILGWTDTFSWSEMLRCGLEKVVLCFLNINRRQIKCDRIFRAYLLSMNSLGMNCEETVECQSLSGGCSWNIILWGREEGKMGERERLTLNVMVTEASAASIFISYLVKAHHHPIVKHSLVFPFAYGNVGFFFFQNQCKRYTWLFNQKLYIMK